MKRYSNAIFYILCIFGSSFLIYFLILSGKQQEAAKGILPNQLPTLTPTWNHFTDSIYHNFTSPFSIILLQITAIILVARVLSWLCKRVGQPSVIGEILAGIALGPSLLGTYFPRVFHAIFPANSLGNLGVMSQFGLILFMFVVGMEVDFSALKNKAHAAIIISHSSIVIPFALGVTLAYFIYAGTAPMHVNFVSYALFIGISMSITAFPVLARIVQERGMFKTRLGVLVITCAAIDDITAWCILAAVIAIVKAGSFTSALYTILLSVIYVLVMLKVVRPFLKIINENYTAKTGLSKTIVAMFLLTLVISSFTTELIGIHALFGAFVAGVIMPTNISFRSTFIAKVEDLAIVLLLPLFFVYTGLRTQIGLLNDGTLWIYCGIFIAVAIIGKFAGSAVAAKFTGQSWRNSLIIGALMNTRGLMELVALNIGYDIGILSPQVFTMLVLMALVTTFMTGPLLSVINRFFKEKEELEVAVISSN